MVMHALVFSVSSIVLGFILCAWRHHWSSRGIIFILFEMLCLNYWNGCLDVNDFYVCLIYMLRVWALSLGMFGPRQFVFYLDILV